MMPMERRERPEKEREMLRKAGMEYGLFRDKMLSQGPQEIYSACRRICFFECVYEYFQYKEEIREDFTNAAWRADRILEELWRLYLKHEYLRVDTWEGIEGMLEVYAREHEAESRYDKL